MPSPARPVPRRTATPGSVHYRREYRDTLGRPLAGTVTLAGQNRAHVGGTIIVPAPVTVELVGGVLDVHLPPDTYTATASLRTVDGARTSDVDTFEIR